MTALPEGLLLCWYGDDFTGSAAVMEVLTFSGMPSLLFLQPPTAEQLARHHDMRAIGVASTARTYAPARMRAELPAAFKALHDLQPDIFHYKVCSTLDSAAHIGSIGCAAEIGMELHGTAMAPVLIAAPAMGRYQAFGSLFVDYFGEVYRLDRHPSMMHHPVTPMQEADVARHIGTQTALKTATLHLNELDAPLPALHRLEAEGVGLFTLDAVDEHHMRACGELLWTQRQRFPFVIGSQGIEFALVEYWRAQGWLERSPAPPSLGRVQSMAAVSGSVSRNTAAQIDWAQAHGFKGIALDAGALLDASSKQAGADAVENALNALSNGYDPLIYTAHGPEDPAIARYHDALSRHGLGQAEANEKLGQALGEILEKIVRVAGLKRAVISGGDTSGFAAQAFGAYALQALAPTIPGASICGLYTENVHDGLQLALKGGQMGSADYFGWVKDGGGQRFPDA